MLPQDQQTEGAAIAYAPVPMSATAPPIPPAQREPHHPLNTHEAARYLGMSESWLRQTRMAGGAGRPPPWHSFGRAIRYFRQEIDSWIATRTPYGEQGKPATEPPAPEPVRSAKSSRTGRPLARRRRVSGVPPKKAKTMGRPR